MLYLSMYVIITIPNDSVWFSDAMFLIPVRQKSQRSQPCICGGVHLSIRLSYARLYIADPIRISCIIKFCAQLPAPDLIDVFVYASTKAHNDRC